MGESIKVAVRLRPVLESEEKVPPDVLWIENSTVQCRSTTYMFDYVYKQDALNAEIYQDTISEKLDKIFQGYNVTVLAYGSTGSGKTHTMGTDYRANDSQSPGDIGAIPRTLQDIFRTIETLKDDVDFVVKVSFLEVYQEVLYDLLNKVAQCQVREERDGIKVLNLSAIEVSTAEEAFALLSKGGSFRRTGATAKNFSSSRSHAMFIVEVEQTHKKTFDVKRSKFQLVDLAGSERSSTSQTEAAQLKEGNMINLGLLTLGRVIAHLVDEKTHVPFRESKLTRLLKDSLGGNSYCIMIACISPSAGSINETINTLRYASKARKIKSTPTVHSEPLSVQVTKLKKQIESLNDELRAAKKGSFAMCNEDLIKEIERLSLDLQNAFVDITRLNQIQLMVEDQKQAMQMHFEEFYREFKRSITETNQAIDNDELSQLIKNLENELETFYHKMLKDSGTILTDVDDGELSNEGSRDLEQPSTDDGSKDLEQSAIEKRSFVEDLLGKQKEANAALNNINEQIATKLKAAENCKDVLNSYDANINEVYIGSLNKKIEDLLKDKAVLESENRQVKETADRLDQYKKEIASLQTELKKKQIALKTKMERQDAFQRMQEDLKELKRSKVSLLRQIRSDSNKFFKVTQQKERDIAKLVKATMRKDSEFVKMKNSLENRINVMAQQRDQAKIALKKIKDDQKFSRMETSKKSVINQEMVENVLLQEGSKWTSKYNIQLFASEYEYLNSCVQEWEMDKGSDDEDVKQGKELLIEFQVKMEEMRKEVGDDAGKLPPVLENITSVKDSKVVVATLFKKYLATLEGSLAEKHRADVNVQNLKNLDLETKETIAALKEKVSCYEEDRRRSKTDSENCIEKIKCEYNKKVLELIGDGQESSGFLEKINLQEKEIEQLKKDAIEKSKELDSLKQGMRKSKRGSRTAYLGYMPNITSVDEEGPPSKKQAKGEAPSESDKVSPSTSPETMEIDFPDEELLTPSHADKSMTGFFLDETINESREDDDVNDPDWRATPLSKRRKNPIRESAAVEKIDSSTDTLAVRSPLPCRCSGTCNTVRCRCKKSQVACTNDCACEFSKCSNLIGSF